MEGGMAGLGPIRLCPWREGRSVQQGIAGGPSRWLKADSGGGRQQKSPRQRQGAYEELGQTTQRSSGAGRLDATAQLAAEPEGRSSAQNRQETRGLTEVVIDTGHKSATREIHLIFDVNV